MSHEWNGSYVMEEFFKIAKEKNFLPSKLKEDGVNVVGNPYTLTPVEDHTRVDKTKGDKSGYGVTKEEGKELIEKAHPKTVQMAKSQGEGGVVENGNQQQEKDIEVATKMPHGSLIGVHAELVNELVKLANYYDSVGDFKKANRIDSTIKKISRPFDGGHLYKEAWLNLVIGGLGIAASLLGPWIAEKLSGPAENRYDTLTTQEHLTDKSGNPVLDKHGKPIPTGSRISKVPSAEYAKVRGIKGKLAVGGAIATALSVLGMLGSYITSIQEDLQIDVNDLYDVLGKVSSPSAQKALQELTPFWHVCQTTNLSDPKNLKQFKDEFDKFVKVFPSIISDVHKSKIEDPSIWPYAAVERAQTKLDDVQTGISDMSKQLEDLMKQAGIVETEAKTDTANEVSSSNIDNSTSSLQKILSHHGFDGKRWNVQITGELDQPTIDATKELQQSVNAQLEKLFVSQKGRKPSKSYDIIDANNKIVMDPKEIINDIMTLERAII